MKLARYAQHEGPLVTPEEFIRRATPLHKERGIFPYCPSCREIVDLYGVHSPGVTSRFDHKNLPAGTDSLDDCILANRNTRFRGMEPDDWDDEAGKKLRAEFFTEENIRTAYAFCLQMCRSGNLPVKKFRSMVARADRKNIWSYAGITLWIVPYILLTLENFAHEPRDGGRRYEFHFLFDKPKGTSISVLWVRPRDCRLKKVFSNSGMPVRADDNPFPISEQAMREKAGDAAWITGGLLRALMATA